MTLACCSGVNIDVIALSCACIDFNSVLSISTSRLLSIVLAPFDNLFGSNIITRGAYRADGIKIGGVVCG